MEDTEIKGLTALQTAWDSPIILNDVVGAYQREQHSIRNIFIRSCSIRYRS
jgi:hypothetical protein